MILQKLYKNLKMAKELAHHLLTHARIVIVGGGVVGCSVAYHLAKLGQTDIVLLEQGKLTSGTTWHAAGLVGQMRPNRNMTRMSKYGIELYSTLEGLLILFFMRFI